MMKRLAITIWVIFWIACLPMLTYTALWLVAATKRPDRVDTKQAMGHGIEYQRVIWNEPRPIVWHVVEVEFSDELEQVTTGKDAESPMETIAATVPEFAATEKTLVAINASYFAPFHANHFFDFHPKSGDPVELTGRCMMNGQVVSTAAGYYPAIGSNGERLTVFLRDEQIPSDYTTYVAGAQTLVDNGKRAWRFYHEAALPRMAVGVDKSGKKLWIVAVDGRQAAYSEGVTFLELAEKLLQLGAWDGMAMDGGGSVTLVMQDAKKKQRVMNAPYQTHFPMNERPVGNSLGIRLKAQPE